MSENKDIGVKNLAPAEFIKNVAAASVWATGFNSGRTSVLDGHLSQDEARKALPNILDASNVPHGDLAVSSKGVHSRRYMISQWQRVATGAVVVVLGEDKNGELCIALGPQRGKMKVPQGYMEASLPKEDLTGLREKNASRVNGSNGDLVMADDSLEDTAVREVWEEIGIKIQKEDLKLLDVSSHKDANPVVHTVAPAYGVKLTDVPQLKTIDKEFIEDDMSNPKWFKVSEIKYMSGDCYAQGSKLPMERASIPTIQKAVKEYASEAQLAACETFLNVQAKDIKTTGRSH